MRSDFVLSSSNFTCWVGLHLVALDCNSVRSCSWVFSMIGGVAQAVTHKSKNFEKDFIIP